MTSFIDRLDIEFEELEERMTKLHAFLETDTYEAMATADQALLTAQAYGMNMYRHFLSLRIASFHEQAGEENG